MTEPTGTPPESATSNPPMSEAEARLRAGLYLQQRLDYQAGYYQSCIQEFNFNFDRTLLFSALLMGVSTVISASSVVSSSAALPFITALLPAFAAAVSAFRSLYQWERQSAIYNDAWIALLDARRLYPDEDFAAPDDYQKALPTLVTRTEEVLRSEAQQWGQLVTVGPKPGEPTGQPEPPKDE